MLSTPQQSTGAIASYDYQNILILKNWIHQVGQHASDLLYINSGNRSLQNMDALDEVFTVSTLPYPVLLGSSLLSHPHVLHSINSIWSRTPSTIVVLIDEAVAHLFSSVVDSLCQQLSGPFRVQRRILEHDEPSAESIQTRKFKSDIEDYLLSSACGRDTGLISIGGGAVGDFCGFVASTYMRGIPYIQIPTTLLAMVDASIGGKTAINTEFGKNLIGSFYDPCLVICDIDFLCLLPARHISNGMAEVIKLGAITDRDLFEYCASNASSILDDRDKRVLKHVVARSLIGKAKTVCMDPKEFGPRATLNFGHSIGHAVESLSLGELLHGESVSIGMIVESSLSHALGYCSSAVIERLRSCLQLFSLPTSVPISMMPDDILGRMLLDKKNERSACRVVIITEIGAALDPVPVVDVLPDSVRLLISPTIAIVPIQNANGRIAVPGSKSVSNRVLVLAALSANQTTISGLLFSDDTLIMITALRALGVSIDIRSDDTVVVHGTAGVLKLPPRPIHFGNAGTAARFVTSLVTLLDRTSSVVLTGSVRMLERPMADLLDALAENGIRIDYLSENTKGFPIRVYGGPLIGGEIKLKATVSSQFVSSLLMITPFASRDVTLTLTGAQVISQPYIDMTIKLMEQCSLQVLKIGSNAFFIQSGQKYRSPGAFSVEGDASSATYPIAIAAVSGGCVTVSNIGRQSIQGDANFCNVLGLMGCTVHQTEDATTVSRDPDQVLDAVDVDLNSMTDAFITLAVCASVARGVTCIRNIANQRLKECNRIDVVVRQLNNIGIEAGELPDGIWINGRPELVAAPQQARIDCHNDHRIAMSFAVLSCRIGNIIIRDPGCVRKTYPDFWHHMNSGLKINLHVPIASSRRTIVLIGMRRAGKTTLGRICASLLRKRFIDMDEEFVRRSGCSLSEYITQHGWAAFRELELELFEEFIRIDDVILATGGGIVESPGAITILQQNLTIEIRCDLDDLLSSEPISCPATPSGSISEIWTRRRPLYESASRFEFPMKRDYDKHKLACRLARFVERILEADFDMPPYQNESFFVCLTLPELKSANLKRISEQCDAVELRVDFLDCAHDLDGIRQQFALIKQAIPDLPIIYTVRSKKHGGRAPDRFDARFPLVLLGIRLGVEYIDIEADWPGAYLVQILDLIESVRCVKIIGSIHHLKSGCSDYMHLFRKASLHGRADIVKVVTAPSSLTECYQFMTARDAYQRHSDRLCIGIGMGQYGAISRVTNTAMSPVTHELLPKPAAPGQYTIQQLTELRVSLGMIKPKQFYLFGYPIDHSRSPAMHNSAFQYCFLPHSYVLHPCSDVTDELVQLIRTEDFGGASVTIPLKERVFSLVDRVTARAKAIGAVNTIYSDPECSSVLIGDNTDFIGIMATLESCHPFQTAVVLGAGGTAKAALYALVQMRLERMNIFLYNRSESRGKLLANKFGVSYLPDLVNLTMKSIDVVISTLPSNVGFQIPDSSPLLSMSPRVFDVNYIETAILRQAIELRWKTITGVQMLAKQGAAQFRLWTGRQAPESVMLRAIDADRTWKFVT